MEYLREESMTEEELQSLVIKIDEAEERGDIREAEILKTQLPFDDYIVSFYKSLMGEQAYNDYILNLKEHWKERNKKTLEKYAVV